MAGAMAAAGALAASNPMPGALPVTNPMAGAMAAASAFAAAAAAAAVPMSAAAGQGTMAAAGAAHMMPIPMASAPMAAPPMGAGQLTASSMAAAAGMHLPPPAAGFVHPPPYAVALDWTEEEQRALEAGACLHAGTAGSPSALCFRVLPVCCLRALGGLAPAASTRCWAPLPSPLPRAHRRRAPVTHAAAQAWPATRQTALTACSAT